MFNYDLLFLGGLFPKEKEKGILNKSKGFVQNAANNLQWELVYGLDKSLNNELKILNSLYIGAYPKRYKESIIKSYSFSHGKRDNCDYNVGFINLPILKIWSKYYTLKPFIKAWAVDKNNVEKKVIIAYGMTYVFVALLKFVKRINTNIVTCLVVPDLPQFMDLTGEMNFLFRLLKQVEIMLINSALNSVDCFVLLTKHMKKVLKIDKPFVVVEGIATNIFERTKHFPSQKGQKTILYSGGLYQKYGIMVLLTAFQRIKDPNCQLIVCGSGPLEKEIKNIAQNDKRIVFLGLLGREEVLRLQIAATILVNPRSNNGDYTKYSFPSKLMEYLSSGRPVLSYRLEGMPEEYFDLIYPIEESENGLYEAMVDVLSKPEEQLSRKGQQAKEYILSKKSNEAQCKKVLIMFGDL